MLEHTIFHACGIEGGIGCEGVEDAIAAADDGAVVRRPCKPDAGLNHLVVDVDGFGVEVPEGRRAHRCSWWCMGVAAEARAECHTECQR